MRRRCAGCAGSPSTGCAVAGAGRRATGAPSAAQNVVSTPRGVCRNVRNVEARGRPGSGNCCGSRSSAATGDRLTLQVSS